MQKMKIHSWINVERPALMLLLSEETPTPLSTDGAYVCGETTTKPATFLVVCPVLTLPFCQGSIPSQLRNLYGRCHRLSPTDARAQHLGNKYSLLFENDISINSENFIWRILITFSPQLLPDPCLSFYPFNFVSSSLLLLFVIRWPNLC